MWKSSTTFPAEFVESELSTTESRPGSQLPRAAGPANIRVERASQHSIQACPSPIRSRQGRCEPGRQAGKAKHANTQAGKQAMRECGYTKFRLDQTETADKEALPPALWVWKGGNSPRQQKQRGNSSHQLGIVASSFRYDVQQTGRRRGASEDGLFALVVPFPIAMTACIEEGRYWPEEGTAGALNVGP